ncbi:MAG: hypothetical protein O2960_27375 [Verrucomicrobia bacterium]|nr:hypothetical protein [Verrucomicrobiota bacterium]
MKSDPEEGYTKTLTRVENETLGFPPEILDMLEAQEMARGEMEWREEIRESVPPKRESRKEKPRKR